MRISVPVEFLVQWDDERVPRAQSSALFGALASAEKTLHANPDKGTVETNGSVSHFRCGGGASE